MLLFSITLEEKDVCGNSKGGVQRKPQVVLFRDINILIFSKRHFVEL